MKRPITYSTRDEMLFQRLIKLTSLKKNIWPENTFILFGSIISFFNKKLYLSLFIFLIVPIFILPLVFVKEAMKIFLHYNASLPSFKQIYPKKKN